MTLRQVLVQRGVDDMWVAEVPSLPGYVSQGSTREEAIANAKDAIEAYVEMLAADGLQVPAETLDAVLVGV